MTRVMFGPKTKKKKKKHFLATLAHKLGVLLPLDEFKTIITFINNLSQQIISIILKKKKIIKILCCKIYCH
jgi:hypothetical protein